MSTPTVTPPERIQTVRWAPWIYANAEIEGDPAELFHEASKFYPSFIGRQTRGGRALEASKDLQYSTVRAVKRSSHRPAVALPSPALPTTSLAEVVHARCSRRSFGTEAVSLAELGTILHTAYGVTHTSAQDRGGGLPLRAVPSGGALYPLEIYVVPLRTEGLECDLYHYDPLRHVLELLHRDSVDDRVGALTAYPELVEPAGALVFVTAMFWRTRFKYGLRGYRFALLEAGHLGQNLMLAATAFDLAAVPVGGVYDARVDGLLEIDGVNESVVYAFSIGKREAEKA